MLSPNKESKPENSTHSYQCSDNSNCKKEVEGENKWSESKGRSETFFENVLSTKGNKSEEVGRKFRRTEWEEAQPSSVSICSEFNTRSEETISFYTNIKHLNPIVVLKRLPFYEGKADGKPMILKILLKKTYGKMDSNYEISQPVQEDM